MKTHQKTWIQNSQIQHKKKKKIVERLSNVGAKVGSNESNQASATLQATLTRARARNNYVDIVSKAKSLEDRKFKITKSGQIDKRFKGGNRAMLVKLAEINRIAENPNNLISNMMTNSKTKNKPKNKEIEEIKMNCYVKIL